MHFQTWGDFLIYQESTFKLSGVFFLFDEDTLLTMGTHPDFFFVGINLNVHLHIYEEKNFKTSIWK